MSEDYKDIIWVSGSAEQKTGLDAHLASTVAGSATPSFFSGVAEGDSAVG